jgi:carboxyl-terminal processing protease
MRLLKSLSIIFLVGMMVVSACKKEDNSQGNPPPTPPTDTQPSAADRLKDTVLLYSKDIYLWYAQIPSTFKPRTYADPDKIMNAIRAYSHEPGFTDPVDRWSFAMSQTDWNNLSSGVAQDFGFSVFFLQEGDLRVKLVEKNSPAGIAGIHRGWQVTKINGSTDITTGNASFIVQNVFYSNATSFTFKKPDGSTVDISLNSATYQEDPIYLDTVYQAGDKKVGYLVFNSFLGDTSAVYNSFNRIFNRFSTEGVNDVVVDLRYNGGGYVSVEEKLADWLGNTASNGQIKMKQEFNDKYASENSQTKFNKLGNLNLSRIFFIVSNSTASASELLINNLKPYMTVTLVGPNPTYGKPVGYFPIPVGDWYIFPISFRTRNAADEGSYFKGLALDHQVDDGLSKDWGDKDEAPLASILKFVGTGSFAYAPEIPGVMRGATYSNSAVVEGNKKLDKPAFKGAIDLKKVRFN